MILTRKLTNVTFDYDTETKLFKILKSNTTSVAVSNVGIGTVAGLTKAEAGSFVRFVFSIFQYHATQKRKRVRNK